MNDLTVPNSLGFADPFSGGHNIQKLKNILTNKSKINQILIGSLW